MKSSLCNTLNPPLEDTKFKRKKQKHPACLSNGQAGNKGGVYHLKPLGYCKLEACLGQHDVCLSLLICLEVGSV